MDNEARVEPSETGDKSKYIKISKDQLKAALLGLIAGLGLGGTGGALLGRDVLNALSDDQDPVTADTKGIPQRTPISEDIQYAAPHGTSVAPTEVTEPTPTPDSSPVDIATSGTEDVLPATPTVEAQAPQSDDRGHEDQGNSGDDGQDSHQVVPPTEPSQPNIPPTEEPGEIVEFDIPIKQ